uniref:Phosphodiesterase n=1 Tax=Neospora caninum (strain Liverpool) TaxID=572307 RepID=A0A0F7UBA5_NEOCL|nr:TPA: 3', 5'-cyclic nucleotide phosphodiesterase,putative [Neospora caninum Liverpool]
MGRLKSAATRVAARAGKRADGDGSPEELNGAGDGQAGVDAGAGTLASRFVLAGLPDSHPDVPGARSDAETYGQNRSVERPDFLASTKFRGRSARLSLKSSVLGDDCPTQLRTAGVSGDPGKGEETESAAGGSLAAVARLCTSPRVLRGLESGLSLLAVAASPQAAGPEKSRRNLSNKLSFETVRLDSRGGTVMGTASRAGGSVVNGDGGLRIQSFGVEDEPDRLMSIKIRGVADSNFAAERSGSAKRGVPVRVEGSLVDGGAELGRRATNEGLDLAEKNKERNATLEVDDTPWHHRGTGRLEALYLKWSKHSVYKFFSEEDRKYFDMAVTGIPCYFSSKNLERSYALYRCPALSGYLLLFHAAWIFCTFLIYCLCVLTRPGVASSRRMVVPFVVSWVISAISIFVVFLWRRTGGTSVERFNRKEKALRKAEEGAIPMYEAYHWRPCFTEDFGTASIGMTTIFPIALGAVVAVWIGFNPYIIHDYGESTSRLAPPLLDTSFGLAGFVASQGYLAFAVLFITATIFSSGIRLRKILYVAIGVMVAITAALVAFAFAFKDHSLYLASVFYTYSVIPVALYHAMKGERLRRFLFFQRERARYGQDIGAEATGASGSATLVEELILLINEAGLKIRRARKKMKYKKCTDLIESEGMLIRCLMILTAGDDLFALRIGEGDGDAGIRENLMDIIGARSRGEGTTSRGIVSTGQLTLSASAASDDDDDLMTDFTKSSDLGAQEMTSFHVKCPEDLWAIVDIRDPQSDLAYSADNRDGTKRKGVQDAGNIFFSHFPQFPAARLHVMLSRKVSIEWNLSMIDVDQQCKGWCLYCVGSDLIFCKVQGFECEKRVVQNFMKVAQMCYQPTIYHNHLHGAQVAHNTVWLARKLELASSLTAPDLVALIVAALCHDIGHQGKNNAFYIASRSPLGIIYNDISVLENFHASLTFKILARPECNLFMHLSPEEFQIVRNRMIDLILATDMKMHFETLSKFRLRRNSPEFCRTNDDDVSMLLRMCIKGGDVSHGLLSWESHVSWSYRAASEFYEQGDIELAQGRTITPMFDRRKHADFPKGQEGFLRFIIIPLYEEIAAVDTTDEIQGRCLQNAFANSERWRQLQNAPEEFEAIDAKHQAIICVLKDRLEWRVQKNIAPTQRLLRAACAENPVRAGPAAFYPTPEAAHAPVDKFAPRAVASEKKRDSVASTVSRDAARESSADSPGAVEPREERQGDTWQGASRGEGGEGPREGATPLDRKPVATQGGVEYAPKSSEDRTSREAARGDEAPDSEGRVGGGGPGERGTQQKSPFDLLDVESRVAI